MLNTVKRSVSNAVKFVTPTKLYLKRYARVHDRQYKNLMEEVGAPEYYINDPKVKEDYFDNLAKYGFPVKYYKELDFYEMADEARRDSYVAPGKLMAMWYGVNCGPSKKIFDNKVVYMKTFSKYLGRDWLYAPEASFEQFIDFCKRNPKMIVKHANGCGGKGIHVFEYKGQTNEDLKSVYERYKEDDCLIEEFIQQKGILHDLNPDSVNCVRICTMRFKDHVEIFQTFIKMGNGHVCVDNAGQGGIFAPIDKDTGIVNRIPYGTLWSEWPIHPVSGIEVKGIKIPCWEQVKELVLKASEEVPDLIYVSWDVAISEDGKLYLIEGNSCGDGMWLKEGGEWPVYMRAIKSNHKYLKYKLVYNYIIKFHTMEIMQYMDL